MVRILWIKCEPFCIIFGTGFTKLELIDKCLIELELAINDQNDDEQLKIALNTADRALESHPHLPIAHLLRAKIQIHLGELSSAVKSVRSALDNNPENHHLAAYLKYLVQKTEGKEPENIIGTDKDQIKKKLNSDLREVAVHEPPLLTKISQWVVWFSESGHVPAPRNPRLKIQFLSTTATINKNMHIHIRSIIQRNVRKCSQRKSRCSRTRTR